MHLAPPRIFFLSRTEGCDLEHATRLCSGTHLSITTSARSSVSTSRSHFSPQEVVIKPVFSEALPLARWCNKNATQNPPLLFVSVQPPSPPDSVHSPCPPFYFFFFSRMLPAPLMTYQYQRSFIKAASKCRLLCFSFAPRFYRWCFNWQI